MAAPIGDFENLSEQNILDRNVVAIGCLQRQQRARPDAELGGICVVDPELVVGSL